MFKFSNCVLISEICFQHNWERIFFIVYLYVIILLFVVYYRYGISEDYIRNSNLLVPTEDHIANDAGTLQGRFNQIPMQAEHWYTQIKRSPLSFNLSNALSIPWKHHPSFTRVSFDDFTGERSNWATILSGIVLVMSDQFQWVILMILERHHWTRVLNSEDDNCYCSELDWTWLYTSRSYNR